MTYISILIGSLSLIAIPFLTGFYSKDLILELALAQFNLSSLVIYVIGVLAAFLTAYYSFRLLLIIFSSRANGTFSHYSTLHEGSLLLLGPILLLLGFSVSLGYLMKEIFGGLGSPLISTVFPIHNIIVGSEFGLSSFEKIIPLMASLLGAFVAILLYHSTLFNSASLIQAYKGGALYFTLITKFLIDVVYNQAIVHNSLAIGLLTNKILDRG